MTVPERLTMLARKAGMPLTCKTSDRRYCRYMFVLDDGREYASAASEKDGRSELRRFLRLYGPALSGPGFRDVESVRIYLNACAPELLL